MWEVVGSEAGKNGSTVPFHCQWILHFCLCKLRVLFFFFAFFFLIIYLRIVKGVLHLLRSHGWLSNCLSFYPLNSIIMIPGTCQMHSVMS